MKRTATASEIKSAYRKIVLANHPDRNPDKGAQAIFLAATQAYEDLNDAERRAQYDSRLEYEAKLAAERLRRNASGAQSAATSTQRPSSRPSAPPPGWKSAEKESPSVAADVQRLTVLFTRGRHAEAEVLARQILQTQARHPVPYAVLGDISRMRGELNEAAKMYAFAAQFEPNNPVYQRRYEELLSNTRIVEDRRNRTRLETEDRQILSPMIGFGVVLLGSAYIALSREAALIPKLTPISTWTIGVFIMLFLSGVAVGASLAAGNLLDRFQSMTVTATGKVGPTVALGTVALANFWAACALYLLLGVFQRAFNFSTTRTVGGVALATSILALASLFGGHVSGGQVFLWGGNLVYLGALCGWMVADTFRF